jgi:hypothetical protein
VRCFGARPLQRCLERGRLERRSCRRRQPGSAAAGLGAAAAAAGGRVGGCCGGRLGFPTERGEKVFGGRAAVGRRCCGPRGRRERRRSNSARGRRRQGRRQRRLGVRLPLERGNVACQFGHILIERGLVVAAAACLAPLRGEELALELRLERLKLCVGVDEPLRRLVALGKRRLELAGTAEAVGNARPLRRFEERGKDEGKMLGLK